MSKIQRKITALISLFFILSSAFCYAKSTDIAGLVNDFQQATDIQRNKILTDNLGKEVSAWGLVSNVGEYDFFNTTEDTKGTYYQVTTIQQKTEANNPYQVIFLFKDKNQVSDINKGENIQRNGKIIRIVDERLQIAVWIFCGDLTEKEKDLLK